MSNQAFCYSAACPSSGSSNIATLGNSSGFPVNFSGGPDTNGNPSTFTVGGWFRLISSGTAVTIFSANGQLLISCDASGYCAATLGAVTVTSFVAITDTNWHFVAVTYAPSQPDETGTLTLYLDGLEVGTELVNANATSSGTGYLLGPNTSQLEFVSWTIWSLALPSDVVSTPQWGDPPAHSEGLSGLVAAFDFAHGSASDISGNNYPVTVAAQCWHTPCLQLQSGQATLPASDTVNPGGGSSTVSAFSIMGWVYVPSAGVNCYYPLLTNSSSVELQLESDENSTLSAFCMFGESTVSESASSGWNHLALTWDGSASLTLYVNGSPFPNSISNPPAPITTPDIIIGSVGTLGPWYMSDLSVWSTCLSQEEVEKYYQHSDLEEPELGPDPTGKPGCVANFNLRTDIGDSINGNELQTTNCTIYDLITPFTTAELGAVPAPQAAAADSGPQLLLGPDLKKIASANGVDVVSPVSAGDAAGPDYAEIGAWFDGIAKKLPAATAAGLKSKFLRNLRIGMALRQKKIQAGTFSMAIEGNDTVGYYHTEAGPQEVYRLPGVELTPMQRWGMTITFDVIGLIAAMFGIVTTAARVGNAVGLLEPEINGIVSAIQAAYNVTDSQLLKAKKVAMAVIGVIYTGNLGYSVAKKIATGSWWSLPFTILSVAATIAGLIATDGASIIVSIVAAAVQLAQLVLHLTQMPQTSMQAAV